MPARGGDFERALGAALPLHVRKIGIDRRLPRQFCRVPHKARIGIARGEMRAHLQERAGRKDRGILHQRRFVRVGTRQNKGALLARAAAIAMHGISHCQRAAHRAQLSRQRQLAGEFVFVQLIARHLFRRGEDAQGNRQIEAPRFLGKLRRCQVHRNSACGKLEARILQRRPDPVLRFLYLGLRQTDDGERRQPVGQMHFDRDFGRIHACQGAALQNGQTHILFLIVMKTLIIYTVVVIPALGRFANRAQAFGSCALLDLLRLTGCLHLRN